MMMNKPPHGKEHDADGDVDCPNGSHCQEETDEVVWVVNRAACSGEMQGARMGRQTVMAMCCARRKPTTNMLIGKVDCVNFAQISFSSRASANRSVSLCIASGFFIGGGSSAPRGRTPLWLSPTQRRLHEPVSARRSSSACPASNMRAGRRGWQSAPAWLQPVPAYFPEA